MLGLDAAFGADGWGYYAAEVADGAEDYWAGHGEEPGRWLGGGAAAAGLEGEASAEGVALLFGEARHPRTGEQLGAPLSEDSVSGYPVSLSPPKSVSLLWALGGPQLHTEVRSAHDAAVQATVAFLDEHAGFVRAGKGGGFQCDAEGLLIAAYTHRTSRDLDPQLHTHLLIANRARRIADGEWRALDGRELYLVQKGAGALYQAALRAELTTRHGIAWQPVSTDGQADVAGVPWELVQHFSTRRQAVEAEGSRRVAEAEARLGRALTSGEHARIFQDAANDTRESKEGAHRTEELLRRWADEAESLGLGPEHWLPEVLGGREHQLGFGLCDGDDLAEEVVDELAEASSHWKRAKVVLAVARRLEPEDGGSAEAVRAEVERVVDLVLVRPEVVRLAVAPPAEVPEALRRRDGLPQNERHGMLKFTTRSTLGLEAEVLDTAQRGRRAGLAVVRPEHVDRAAEEHRLGDDQAAAVARLCRGGEAITCLVGPAGAGKSRAMGGARAAWEAAGVPVRGVAVSAVAAGVLQAEAGLPSETLAKFLHENARVEPEPGWRLRPGEVVVLDEAGTVGTKQLVALVRHAEAARAKVVLVGDHRQLGAVGAGGLFGLLVAETQAPELSAVRRFAEPWEAEASLRLRAGDARVLAEYEARGRIGGGSRTEVLEAAFASWLQARSAGQTVTLLAGDHATVDALALRARAVRVAAGEVERVGVPVGRQLAAWATRCSPKPTTGRSA